MRAERPSRAARRGLRRPCITSDRNRVTGSKTDKKEHFMINDFERFDVRTGQLGKGDLFIGPSGQQVDLSGVRVLWTGVDTLRQMFSGVLIPERLAEIVTAYEDGFGNIVQVNGYDFVVKSGKKGGYKYLLQNNELGLTLLVHHLYSEADAENTHLKIECSPRWIYERDPDEITDELAHFGFWFLKNLKPIGIAIHMAVDFQGWEPPQDFDEHFVTRAKTVTHHNYLSELRLEANDFSSVAGRRQGFTFGKANGLQTCLYNKSREMLVSDKRDFMESIWSQASHEDCFPDSAFDPEKPVWRLEMRLHHRIVNEIWQGTGIEPLYTFERAAKHLTGLWKYALKSNRYESKRDWVHPIWTKLREDVRFGHAAPDLMYKRVKKTPGVGNEKNVALAFGNLLSVYARNNFNAKQAWDCLKRSGLWEDLCNYYRRRDITEGMLFELVRDNLIRRRMLGKVAA